MTDPANTVPNTIGLPWQRRERLEVALLEKLGTTSQ